MVPREWGATAEAVAPEAHTSILKFAECRSWNVEVANLRSSSSLIRNSKGPLGMTTDLDLEGAHMYMEDF